MIGVFPDIESGDIHVFRNGIGLGRFDLSSITYTYCHLLSTLDGARAKNLKPSTAIMVTLADGVADYLDIDELEDLIHQIAHLQSYSNVN